MSIFLTHLKIYWTLLFRYVEIEFILGQTKKNLKHYFRQQLRFSSFRCRSNSHLIHFETTFQHWVNVIHKLRFITHTQKNSPKKN